MIEIFSICGKEDVIAAGYGGSKFIATPSLP